MNKKILLLLLLTISNIQTDCAGQTNNWEVFEKLETRMTFPSATNVDDVVQEICDHIGINVDIPDKLKNVELDRAEFDPERAEYRLLVKTCLAITLKSKGYDYAVLDGKLVVFANEQKLRMKSAAIHSLAGIDDQTINAWEGMLVRIVQPSIWKRNGGESIIEVLPKQKKVMIQCPYPVHDQIENFNLVLSSFVLRQTAPTEHDFNDIIKGSKVLDKTKGLEKKLKSGKAVQKFKIGT